MRFLKVLCLLCLIFLLRPVFSGVPEKPCFFLSISGDAAEKNPHEQDENDEEYEEDPAIQDQKSSQGTGSSQFEQEEEPSQEWEETE